MPLKFVYHDGYDLNLGQHVFPSQKFRWLRDQLRRDGIAAPGDFVKPEPATDDDLLLVHDAEWIRKLKTGTLSYAEILRLEIPYTRQTMEAFWIAAGGTKLAATLALENGIGFNVGGGFHHAFREHGEGFCAINDIAVAIRCLQRDGKLKQAMVVDCDVHDGNGTAAIFAHDDSVYTLSIHQLNNYPSEKPPSNLDINLADGVGDSEYVERLEAGLSDSLARFSPDLLVYVAGADPYFEDQLGGLSLTFDGLSRRDRLVIGTALNRGIPVAVVLAGGYAYYVQDTITIHCNTARNAKQALAEIGWKPPREDSRGSLAG